MNFDFHCPNCDRVITVTEPGFHTCPHCAQSVDVEPSVFKQNLSVPAPPIPQPITKTTSGEQPLFHEEGIVITPTQVISHGSLLAVRNIASITTYEKLPSRWPWFFLFFGVMVFAGGGFLVGGIIALVSLALIILRKSLWQVIVSTSSGTDFRISFKKHETAHRASYAISQAIAML